MYVGITSEPHKIVRTYLIDCEYDLLAAIVDCRFSAVYSIKWYMRERSHLTHQVVSEHQNPIPASFIGKHLFHANKQILLL